MEFATVIESLSGVIDLALTLMNLTKTAVTLVIAYFLYKFLLKIVYGLSQKLRKELRLKNTMRLILGLFVSLVTLMVILSIWRVNLLPYLTAFGISGLVIGLALQEPLTNFISGLLVLITGKLTEGDVVDIDGVSGVVEVVHFNYTVLRTFDGKKIVIPNRQVWSSRVTDFWPGPIRRLSMAVSVSYNSDIEKVVKVLQRCIESEPLVVKENVTNEVAFIGFGNSFVDFEVRFWVKRESFLETQIALANRIKREFEREGIEIPYPQLDVHLKREDMV